MAVAAGAVAGAASLLPVRARRRRQSRVTACAEAALPKRYDPALIADYWGEQPAAAWGRGLKLAGDVANSSFISVDNGGPKLVNTPEAAEQAVSLLIRWGATFVKLGQVAAVRPDFLPESYVEPFQKLFEAVPPSKKIDARSQVEAATGKRLEDLFEDTSAFRAPVASASVGQVYRAKVKDGTEVAVKIRRQGILEQVTLDMYIIRSVAEFLHQYGPSEDARGSAEAFLELSDTALCPFMEELDFTQEAANQSRFRELAMSSDLIKDCVVVPKVFACSADVLIQEWVEGTKISKMDTQSIEGVERSRELVRTLLNSYMVQFLETGFLHGDPHPGNFLLTPDGKLCILDFGLMQEIPKEKQVSFIEYIMHLTAKEYDKCLEDLIRLDFLQDGIQNDPRKKQIQLALADTLDTIYGEGAGLSKEKVEKLQNQTSRLGLLADELDEIAKQYPLTVPPYFVLVLRAFGTLEGLGLRVDSNFAVLDGLFPYMARRLLTDDSPRIRAALKSFLYSKGGKLSLTRVQRLSRGFGSFTNEMTSFSDASLEVAQLDAATRDLISLVFSEEGNLLQDLLAEEAVRSADALSRAGAAALARGLLDRAVTSGGPLPALPGMQELSNASETFLGALLTREDREALVTIRRIASIAGLQLPGLSRVSQEQDQPRAALGFSDLAELGSSASVLRGALAENLPGVQAFSQKFVRKLTARSMRRLAGSLMNQAASSSSPALGSPTATEEGSPSGLLPKDTASLAGRAEAAVASLAERPERGSFESLPWKWQKLVVVRDLRRLQALLVQAAQYGEAAGGKEAQERALEAWNGYLWGVLLPAVRRMDVEFSQPMLTAELRRAGALGEAQVVIDAIGAAREDFFRTGDALDLALQAGNWQQARVVCDELVKIAEVSIRDGELRWVPQLIRSFVPVEAQKRLRQDVAASLELSTALTLVSAYEELARADNNRVFEEEHPFLLRATLGQIRKDFLEPTGAPFLDDRYSIEEARGALRNSGASPIRALDSVLGAFRP